MRLIAGIRAVSPVTWLKLIAATLLIAGTLGYLWHPDNDWRTWGGSYFYSEFNLAQIPKWLFFGPGGWYPTTAMTIWWVFHTAPNVAWNYLAAVILGLLTIYAVAFVRITWLRIMLTLCLGFVFFYDFTILQIAGVLPDTSTTKVMIANWRFGMDGTVFVYGREILVNLLFIIAVMIIFALPPRKPGTWLSWTMPPLVILAFVGSVSWALYKHRAGQHEIVLPSPFATMLNVNRAFGYADVSIRPSGYLGKPAPQVEKIVVIMDESVRANYASARPTEESATPFLNSIVERVADFGVTSSAANCSITTRQSLRHMMRQEHAGLPMAPLLSRTTMWQYAQQAGFETIHLDAFGSPVTLSSNMTATERSFVARRDAYMELPVYRRDQRIARELRTLLRSPGRQFIFVEKYGVHVPYPHAYPLTRNIYGANNNLPFTLEVTGIDQIIRHYKNAINWSVDEFFREFLSEPLPPGTVMIYTSDHGQSLSQGGRKLSHCSFSGVMRASEAAVPLIIQASDPALNARFIEAANRNVHQVSHYHLPSTMLELMGFDARWRQAEFDQSLLDPAFKPSQRFVRFGATAAEFNYPD